MDVFKSLVVSRIDLWRLQLCVSVQNSTQCYWTFLQCVLCVSKQHSAIQQHHLVDHTSKCGCTMQFVHVMGCVQHFVCWVAFKSLVLGWVQCDGLCLGVSVGLATQRWLISLAVSQTMAPIHQLTIRICNERLLYCTTENAIALHYGKCNAQFFQWRSLKSQTSEIAQWNSTIISQSQMTNFIIIITAPSSNIIITIIAQIFRQNWSSADVMSSLLTCWQADGGELGQNWGRLSCKFDASQNSGLGMKHTHEDADKLDIKGSK